MTAPAQTLEHRADARARAYALLADLLARGPTAETRAAAESSPTLADALAHYRPGDLEELAVDHQHAFGFCVHPFEGAFLDPEARVGGALAPSLRQAYERIGFAPDPTGEDAEHLATELRALALSSRLESDAAALGRREDAERLRQLTRSLLDHHVLRWLPPLASAVARVERPFPTALVRQARDLAMLHRASLGGPYAAWALPPLGLDLGEPSTGLKDIARLLATPARAGIYLGRHDVGAVGRELGVPHGFGDRATLLTNLLETAVHLDALPAVVERLIGRLRAAREDVAVPAPFEEAGLEPLLAPWRERGHETESLLRRLHGEAAAYTCSGASSRDASP